MHFFLEEQFHHKFLLQQNWLRRFLPASAACSQQTIFQAHRQAAELGQQNWLGHLPSQTAMGVTTFYSFPYLCYKFSLTGLVENIHLKVLLYLLQKVANNWCYKGQRQEEHEMNKEQKEGKANERGRSGQFLQGLTRYGQGKG